MTKWQLMYNSKPLIDITSWDALVLQGVLEGAEKAGPCISISSGPWELKAHEGNWADTRCPDVIYPGKLTTPRINPCPECHEETPC